MKKQPIILICLDCDHEMTDYEWSRSGMKCPKCGSIEQELK